MEYDFFLIFIARLSAPRPLVAAGPHAASQGGGGRQGREPRLQGLKKNGKNGEFLWF